MWGRLMNIKGEMAIKIKFVSHEGTFLMMKKKPVKILLDFSCSVFEIFWSETCMQRKVCHFKYLKLLCG